MPNPTNPDNPFLPPEPPSYWTLWLLVPAAVLGIPVAGILMIAATPHPPSSNGSVAGLMFFPFLTGGMAVAAGLKVEPAPSARSSCCSRAAGSCCGCSSSSWG